MNETPQVLVVDDQPQNLEVLTRLLAGSGWKVRAVTSGERALEAARLAPPDCVLMDVAMPGMDGYATCRAFAAEEQLASIPIIFLTAFDTPEHRLRAFEEGGRDYVTKPFQASEVVARVGNQLRILTMERELREQNRKLAELNAQLEQVAMLKERATAMLVHDIRSPLTVIGAALADPQDSVAVADAMAAFTKAAHLLNELLKVYGSAARDEQRQQRRVALRALVEDAVAGHRHVARQRGLTLETRHASDVSLLADVSELDRVIANLVDNAMRHTQRGGRITVATETEEGLGPEKGMRFAVISVTDSGEGIAAEELPYIFDLYRQRAPSAGGGGAGLGLSIVQRLVAAHGGRVHVRSKVGVGSEFRVLIPT